MKCRHCGAELDEGARFCRFCGTEIPTEPEFILASEPELDIEPELTPEPEPVPESESDLFTEETTDIPLPESDQTIAFDEAAQTEQQPKKRIRLRLPKPLSRVTPRFLIFCGISALLLVALLVVILSTVSCSAKDRFDSPEAVQNAVIAALERGDGDRLYTLAETSVPVLGEHPERFGEGRTPQAVMKHYYRALAEDFHDRVASQYGKNFRLEFPAETSIQTGGDIFEANRALGIDAAQYAVISGTLFVDSNSVGTISMTAAEIDGEWKLLALYLLN